MPMETLNKLTRKEAAQKAARELVHFACNNDRLAYLKSRWMDEREYEDFADYEAEIRKVFTEGGYDFRKATKSFQILIYKDGAALQLRFGSTKASVEILNIAVLQ